MLSEKQINRMLSKLRKFENVLSERIFVKEDEVSMKMFATKEAYDTIPEDSLFTQCKSLDTWGGESSYCWFKGQYQVPEKLHGKTLYLYPKIEGYEAMLFIDGKPFGTFCTKIVVTGHGNHYSDMIKKDVVAGECIDLALEYYSGHYVIGCDPWSIDSRRNYEFTYNSVDICTKNDMINDFYFDLKVLNQMVSRLDSNSFRRADIINTLTKVHEILYYSVEDINEKEFLESISLAAPLLKEQLSKVNSQTVPFAGLIGHSHMDTAWLWHQGETIKKCARTYSNELNLMEQYPEYTFIQSSAYHGDMIRRHYPELFERIAKKVAEGRYEPNGGVWIECDCNITSGESMVRQFLWGQRFTRKYFNYTSNCFWLPDTFGYSASIPQIMKGCKVDYFLTTKMSWNDTTDFPYDTFYWKGIDGTKVLTHLNKSHTWPDVDALVEYVVDGDNGIKEKTVSDKKLIAYGFGDGGGGPQYEMIEMARRLENLEGLPKSNHLLVGDFMKSLEESLVNPSVHNGELYLEIHRGTLTNQHTIKRNNRLAEKKLRDLEFLTVYDAVENDKAADSTHIAPLMGTLLVNQFHDILPGTCIPRAHEECITEMNQVIKESGEKIDAFFMQEGEQGIRTIVNTLSFVRRDVVYIDYVEGYKIKGEYRQQLINDYNGHRKIAILDVVIPAFGSTTLELEEGDVSSLSVFKQEGNVLTTPTAIVCFDDNGYISSYFDKEAERELRGEGYALNTFLIAEDMPEYWDSWDIDADIELKFRDQAKLISSKVVCDGAVEYRIRNEYQITEKSTLIQDMIFGADTKAVRFETKMNWQDNHRFLKTAFDVSVYSDFARHEIQFGYLKRNTSRNTPAEKAKFEVSNHKYTDISENRYGIAILNDCKYGISVMDSNMRLSLHKGGCRPDYNGDKGVHECAYSFLPHNKGFEANSVIRPSYEFNYPVIIAKGNFAKGSFASVNKDNIIIETIKPCEDTQNAYILRLYEAEGTFTNTNLSLLPGRKKVYITNMLEEVIEEFDIVNKKLSFKAFEIKTLKVVY